ncbi:hypothetical protein [Nitratifractor salsuginis]|uniref:Uncharacterized protein n=1 Tax=Nitratifractor salsuginis (strain DSM 16511 / JCM 12458 / E9I37-1) TaxID=749222 RepID=E6X0I7_NITSE|nr:hypothetical protein [Nitratifractor salsuginis]ADV46837.1 hypothetical protein Nitsa_1589 [Nitratifractor salsuginis DSM 16511]
MSENTKEELLTEIEKLMAYGKEEPTINPSLLKYLDLNALTEIRDKLKERSATLKEEDKEWLQQFRKED